MPIGAVLGFKGFAKVTDMSSSARSCNASFQDAEGHKSLQNQRYTGHKIPLQNRLSILIHTQTVALWHPWHSSSRFDEGSFASMSSVERESCDT